MDIHKQLMPPTPRSDTKKYLGHPSAQVWHGTYRKINMSYDRWVNSRESERETVYTQRISHFRFFTVLVLYHLCALSPAWWRFPPLGLATQPLWCLGTWSPGVWLHWRLTSCYEHQHHLYTSKFVGMCWLAMPLGAGILFWVLVRRTIEKKKTKV